MRLLVTLRCAKIDCLSDLENCVDFIMARKKFLRAENVPNLGVFLVKRKNALVPVDLIHSVNTNS